MRQPTENAPQYWLPVVPRYRRIRREFRQEALVFPVSMKLECVQVIHFLGWIASQQRLIADAIVGFLLLAEKDVPW